jgi:polyphosphate kinase
MGTGNYHPTTTKFYTDFGLLTANAALAKDVNEVFISLTSLAKPRKLQHLWIAPFELQRELVKAIRNETQIAKQGGVGQITAKMNSLVDESIIEALYEASQAGVKIELIVRGACSLRPGVPSLSETIRVRSIVGRFLEHSRIFNFLNEGANDVYLSSADWMNRKLVRRVELAWPINDPVQRQRLIDECLLAYLHDGLDAWDMQADGSYRASRGCGILAEHSAQTALMARYGTTHGKAGTA